MEFQLYSLAFKYTAGTELGTACPLCDRGWGAEGCEKMESGLEGESTP